MTVNRSDFVGKPQRSSVDADALGIYWDPTDPQGEPFVAPMNAHDASAISVLDTAGNYTATDVEAVLAELPSRFGSEVSLVVRAACPGFVPVGMDAANNRIYAIHERANTCLFTTTDPTLRQWVTLFSFGGTHTVQAALTTAAGSLLVHTTTASAGFIYRSTDGGKTFTQVHTSPQMGATRRSMCQTPNGDIFVADYSTSSGTYTTILHRSNDDGATWATAKQWTNTGNGPTNEFRHIHFAVSDPFVEDRLWIGVGDGAILASQSNIGYSDDRGATFTWLSNTPGQTYRSVDLLFTADALWWGMDAPAQAQKIIRYDRTTGQISTFLDDAVSSLYYGVSDGTRALWTSFYEDGALFPNNQTPNTRIFTGSLSATAAPWRAVFVDPAIPSATRAECWPIGPLANGSIIFGTRHVKSGQFVQTIYRANMIDSETSGDGPIAPTREDHLASAPTGFVLAGPHPHTFGTNSVTAGANNRILLNKVQPVQDCLVSFITYAVGGTSNGNVVGALWECDASGNPTNQLAVTATTAQGSIDTAQQLAFDRPVFLAAGRNYWASIQFSSATATALGADVRIVVPGQHRFSDAAAFPAPNPLGVTPAATVRQIAMLLVCST